MIVSLIVEEFWSYFDPKVTVMDHNRRFSTVQQNLDHNFILKLILGWLSWKLWWKSVKIILRVDFGKKLVKT